MQRNRLRVRGSVQVLRRSIPCQPEGQCCSWIVSFNILQLDLLSKRFWFSTRDCVSSSAFGLGRSQSHSRDWIWLFFEHRRVCCSFFGFLCAKIGANWQIHLIRHIFMRQQTRLASKCKTLLVTQPLHGFLFNDARLADGEVENPQSREKNKRNFYSKFTRFLPIICKFFTDYLTSWWWNSRCLVFNIDISWEFFLCSLDCSSIYINNRKRGETSGEPIFG